MSRKQTRRTIRDPMAWITQRTPLADNQQRDIGLAYRLPLQSMLRGYGTEEAWNTLTCSMNIALILAEKGNGAAHIETIKHAQDALLRARARAARTGKWALDGEGIHHLKDAANIHDEQLSRETRGTITAALNEVHRRIEIGEVFA